MKKIGQFFLPIMLIASIISSPMQVNAGNIDNTKARQVASYFMASQFGNKAITADNMKLVYEIRNTTLNIPALFIFNTVDNRGFIVISGSDCLSPVIAYSTEGCFDPNNIPPAMMNYLNEQVQMIAYAQNIDAKPEACIANEWRELTEQTLPYFGISQKAITKLLKSKWNQDPLYNDMCPIINGNRAVTGCVATAMAQIIYYWRFPWVGKGQHTYWLDSLGADITVKFGETYYDYDAMVDELTYSSTQQQINAVALLSYHCGVAVDMDYSYYGSGTSSTLVPRAMKMYFKYDKDSIDILQRSDSRFNNPNSATSPNSKDTAWVSIIHQEIMKGRPVYYSGNDPTAGGIHAGHAFVCDGYNSVTDKYWFNWGWGGYGNCWCNIYNSQLKAQGMGYNFTAGHQIIIGIQPPADTLAARNVGITETSNPFTASVYPNPASQQITVNYLLDEGQNSELQIFDAAGRMIESLQLSPASTEVTIPVANYRPGVYFCRLNGHSIKFIKK